MKEKTMFFRTDTLDVIENAAKDWVNNNPILPEGSLKFVIERIFIQGAVWTMKNFDTLKGGIKYEHIDDEEITKVEVN